jgi:hypothetical protein
MVKDAGGAGLFEKAAFLSGVDESRWRETFEGDRPVEQKILCLAHNSHCAGAEVLKDLVVRDGLSFDHFLP